MNPFSLPVHPIVVHAPLAMLAAAWVCTLGHYLFAGGAWAERGGLFETIAVAALPVTIAAGFIDTRGWGPIAELKWDQPLIWHVLASLTGSAVVTGHLLWRRGHAVIESRRAAALDLGWITAGLWIFVLAGGIAGEMVYA